MNEKVKTLLINQNSSIKEAIDIINKGLVGAAFIVEDSGKLVGIVTDGDIRRAILKDVKTDISIRLVMNNRPFTLSHRPSLREAQEIMLRRHIMIIPIVDDDNLIIDYVYLMDINRQLKSLADNT